MHCLGIAFKKESFSKRGWKFSVSINSLNESCETLITTEAAIHVKLDLYLSGLDLLDV